MLRSVTISLIVVLSLLAARQAQAQCQLDESAKLLASDPAGNDRFGNSIAIYGDTAMIGADWDDNAGGNNAGAAYAFVHSGGVWTEQTKLTASDAAAGDIFGASVSVFGNTAVIGAALDDHTGGTDAGAAYVFVRSDGVWTEQTKLTASDAAGGDYFGYSVSVSGDTAVIGAFYHDHAGGSDAGAAYVFVRSGGVWTEQAKLTASDAAADDHFGWSVAVSGDTVVIGAHFADPAGVSKAGAAYVFVRSGSVWTEQAKLTASDGAADDFFGCSVGVSDETVLIGASGDDHAGVNGAGSAYVFVKPGGGWVDMTETAKLTVSDAAAMDGFGHCCSVSGDTAVIGAFGDDHTGEASAGSAYVFVRSGSVWTERAKLVASDAAADDRFGISVCVSGGTAVIGADTDDHAGGTDAGAAYVFGGLGDCNANGVPDDCDIALGTSADCQLDGLPDECQVEGILLPFTDPAPLNNNAATDSGADYLPQVATDGTGNWVAVWRSEDELDAGLGTDRDILVARSVDNGVTWTDPAPLNNNASTDSGDDSDPRVITDNHGVWLVAWSSDETMDCTIGGDFDIFVARSTDGGLTWTDPTPLNNDAATDDE
ncbi:MAG: hypothetical protein JSV19_03410, partial [Phycisphaerales bacterium]